MLASLPQVEFNCITEFTFTSDVMSFLLQIPNTEYTSVVAEVVKGVQLDVLDQVPNLAVTHLGEKLSATLGFTPSNLTLINFAIILSHAGHDQKQVFEALSGEFLDVWNILCKVLGDKFMSRAFYFQFLSELYERQDIGSNDVHVITFRSRRRPVKLVDVVAHSLSMGVGSEVVRDVAAAWWAVQSSYDCWSSHVGGSR